MMRSFSGGSWPKPRLLAALKRRYGAVRELGEDSGFSLYGVNEGDINFAVALRLAEGAPEKVSDVGFLARFSGFNLNRSELEGINRNLHISVASFHTDGDLYLIGGVSASGEFNEGAFRLVLEAWKRDLLVVLGAMNLGSSFADAAAAARLEAARRFAVNRPPKDGGAAALFASLAGGRSLAACAVCDGRGKTGLLARACEACGGSGFVARSAGR